MIEVMDAMNASFVVPNLDLTTEGINLKFYPDDNETSLWMYAMIFAGSSFVVFVVITIYLMCHSTIRQVAEEDVKFRAVQSRMTYRKCPTAEP